MRILFVTRKFPPSVGGMEVFAEQLAAALQQECSGFRLFKPDPPIIGRPGPATLLRFLVKASLQIWREARTVDIVLLGDALLTPLVWLAKLSTRGTVATVVTAHGNDLYYAGRPGPGSVIYRVMLRFFSRYADLLIANSSDTRKAAVALGFRHTSRIPLATRLPQKAEPPPTRRDAILFAGRLIHYKGLAWFISEVLPKVAAHVKLLVAGPAWDSEELLAVEICPRAVYLGNLSQEELAQLRLQVIACIMPNLPARLTTQNEGFGLSALESAAAGTPVVAAKVGGLAEAVVDGVTGFLVDPMHADDFAARINDILGWGQDRREQFAQTARQTIQERFTWNRVADDYMAEFERLGGPKRDDSEFAP